MYLPFSDWFGTKRTLSACVPNQSVHGKYNLISVWFNKIWERFPCVCGVPPSLRLTLHRGRPFNGITGANQQKTPLKSQPFFPSSFQIQSEFKVKFFSNFFLWKSGTNFYVVVFHSIWNKLDEHFLWRFLHCTRWNILIRNRKYLDKRNILIREISW